MKKSVIFIFAVIVIDVIIILFANNANKTDDDQVVGKNESEIKKQSAEKLIDVPNSCQYPELPTGCESVAATMVLQYYDVNITAEEFADSWLSCSDNFYSSGNKLYGPDPNDVFAGNPFNENSYGCFASVIVKAVNNHSTECKAEKITGKSLNRLCEEYIDNGKPLCIWATMGMKESKKGRQWYLQNGSLYTWISSEHCLVLVGYNDDYYFLNDPMSGSTVAYQKNIVEKRFKELGSQAVYIYRKNNS